MLFSIVIPAFNRASTIEPCINSVLSQSNQNFEIIVVDDGSKDNTKDVVERIRDNRIRYIYQENGGGSKARNTGIVNAQGKYIAFLDSDDVFLPHHLSNALTVLEKGDNICTYSQVIVSRGDKIRFLKPNRAIRENEHISEYLMCDRGFIPTITLVVPRWLALLSKYDERIRSGQDYDIAIKLVANGGKLVMLDEPAAIWSDQWDASRLSNKPNPILRMEWLDRIKDNITPKAYWAELGWPVAKNLAHQGHRFKALKLYFQALFRGCYHPKMAIVVFLQVVLSKSAYRRMSDILAKFGVQP